MRRIAGMRYLSPAMKYTSRTGFRFSYFDKEDRDPFDKLFEIFQELITHTSGDVDEALDWLEQLDQEYGLTDENYTIEDFVEDLKARGYLREEIEPGEDGGQGSPGEAGGLHMSAKLERALRKRALEQIFGKLKQAGRGNHRTPRSGAGDEYTGDFREYRFGDSIEDISMTESLKNAQMRNGWGNFELTDADLVVNDRQYMAQMSTVLMIDISHSMILYGEDRITPAKKVAMALAELIMTRYPKDTLDILVFGNDAWPISVQELPYLQVGPYHTNTVAGLQLAMDMLRRKKNSNKQIFMITDGKPSCLREADGTYYKNSVGLDEYIVEKCYTMAQTARKLQIPITTFMIARDPYLMSFVRNFTEANQGKAFYTGLSDLGEMIFEDYEQNRRRRIRG